jgi:hypothetical protein
MMEREQMQTITVDGEVQATWLSEVRRFHPKVKLLVEDIDGRQHTLVEIGQETASLHSFDGPASKINLVLGSRRTSWSCHIGPTTSLHIRVDIRGQPEVWSGSIAVAKLFAVDASPDDWPPGLVHAKVSYVRDLAALLSESQTTGLKSLDMDRASALLDLQPIENLTGLTSLSLAGCREISDIGPVAGLNQLTALNLENCGKVGNIEPLRNLTQLKSLNLERCVEINNIDPLESLKELTSINLAHCRHIIFLDPLSDLTHLTSLTGRLH